MITTINADRIVRRKDFLDPHVANRLAVSSVFRTIQGEGPFAGRVADFLRLAGCNFGDKQDHCDFCFPEDTVFQTAHGKKKFKDVRVGDELFALDENGNITTTKVKKVLTRAVDKNSIVNLTFDVDGTTRKLTCTDEHPIHTSNRGFVPAKDLKASDRIVHVKPGELQSFINSRRLSENNPSFDKTTVAKQKATFRKRFSNDQYDLSRTDAQKARYSASKLGDKNPMKRHDVRLKSAQGHVYPKSKLEMSYEELFQQLGINAKYVANTGFAVGNDEVGYRIPDFKLPGKKVIETYNTTFKYVRGGKRTRRTRKNYEEPTRAFYESLGYEVLFLTEKDRPGYGIGSGNKATPSNFATLKAKVVAFKRNGAKLVKRTTGLVSSAGRYANADGKVNVVNFSCAPYNTFLVNDIHTHNCDTAFQLDNATWISLEAVRTILLSQMGYDPKDILVVTGGEPTLQNNLLPFLELVKGDFSEIQIETNGTQAYFFDEVPSNVYTVVSPKASKKIHGYAPLSPRVMEKASCLKFVLSADPESAHHTVPDWAMTHKQVYVSPMAVYARPYEGEVSSIWVDGLFNKEETAANYAYAAQYAMKHNLILSLQTHLFTNIP